MASAPDRREQASIARSVWTTERRAGATWNVIDARWFRVWCHYCGFDPDAPYEEEPHDLGEDYGGPGPITNSELSGEHPTVLKRGMVENLQFTVIPSALWSLLERWYGGGPEFPRDVTLTGIFERAPRLDLFPVILRLRFADRTGDGEGEGTGGYRRFPATSTFRQIQFILEKEHLETASAGPGSADTNETLRGVDFIRFWLMEPMKDQAEDEAEEAEEDMQVTGRLGLPQRWRMVKNEGLDCTLASYDFPPGETVMVELQAEDGAWTWSPVKKDFRNFVVGDLLDACDRYGRWYEAEIKAIDYHERSLHIHFLGYEDAWDEEFGFDSSKLDVLGSHTSKTQAEPTAQQFNRWSAFSNVVDPTADDAGPSPFPGTVGLRNLGNTCFMNATLQCLNQTPLLTQYFVDEDYVRDINRVNPLGWKGRVADEFGNILREMWAGKRKLIAPTTFKRTIGEFQPRFNGYQQQDSQELLSFLLDGLHEDLNKVRDKPSTNPVLSNGRPDAEVAAEAWYTYLLRNQSRIVDTLQGQIKSRVVCPDCKNVSITFDPFMYVSVPLPQPDEKAVRATFVPANRSKPMVDLEVKVPKVAMIAELKRAVAEAVNANVGDLLVVDLFHARVNRFFSDHDSLKLIHSDDEIFVHEIKGFRKANKGHISLVQLVHCAELRAGGKRSKDFGLPLIVKLDKTAQPTLGDLLALAEASLDPFITADKDKSAYKLFLTDTTGRACFRCDATDECTGCDLRALADPSEAIDLSDGPPQVSVVWLEKAAGFDEGRLARRRHKSVMQKEDEDSLDEELNDLHLFDCFDAFTKDELLSSSDAWFCPGCGKHQQARKQLEFWRLPDVLVVHVKRFSYSHAFRDKITAYVEFPVHGLDMSRYCVNKDEEDTKYNLYAICNHMGGIGGGHYTAFVKNLVDQSWYYCDDTHIERVEDIAQIQTESAYVLFYHRATVAPSLVIRNQDGSQTVGEGEGGSDDEPEPHHDGVPGSNLDPGADFEPGDDDLAPGAGPPGVERVESLQPGA